MPAQEQCGAAGGKATKDVIGWPAQDRGIVEGSPELEERDVEHDRHDDRDDSGDLARVHEPSSTRRDDRHRRGWQNRRKHNRRRTGKPISPEAIDAPDRRVHATAPRSPRPWRCLMSISSTRPELSIDRLRDAVNGSVIGPDDPDYDAMRSVMYGGIDPRPAVIVRVADAADIAAVIDVARGAGLPLAVRSGGHSGAGHSDRRRRHHARRPRHGEIEIDRGSDGVGVTGSPRRVHQRCGGARAGDRVRRHGLGGDRRDHTGWRRRLPGAKARVHDRRSARRRDRHGGRSGAPGGCRDEPDLFWALRGAGGNFGVVTRFHSASHELDGVVGGILVLPATAETIAGIPRRGQGAPDELGPSPT